MAANSKYTEEFKIKVAEATLEDGATLKSVGEKFGVNPTLVRNWRIKYVEGTPSDGGGDAMKKISDEQLTEIFGDVEDKINEQGAYAEFVENAGSNLEYVQLDVSWNDDGTWNFIMRLVVEEVVELDENDKRVVEDDLELYADRLYQKFEQNGLDPQEMGDYVVEIAADE